MEQTSFYKYISMNNISFDELRLESDSESKLLYTNKNSKSVKSGEEFEIKVILPPNWNNKTRRINFPIPGANEEQEDDRAIFKIKLKEIKQLSLPEITIEIAKREGFDSIDELRRGIKVDLQNHKDQQEEL